MCRCCLGRGATRRTEARESAKSLLDAEAEGEDHARVVVVLPGAHALLLPHLVWEGTMDYLRAVLTRILRQDETCSSVTSHCWVVL